MLKADACICEPDIVEEASAPLDYVTANVSRCAGERVGTAREERGVARSSARQEIEEERDVEMHPATVRGRVVVVESWREGSGRDE